MQVWSREWTERLRRNASGESEVPLAAVRGGERFLVSGGGALRRFPYVTQTELEPIILLPRPRKRWNYKRAPPHPAQGMFLKASAP